MTIPVRFLVRLIFSGFYAILTVAVVTFMLSDIKWLFWLAILLFLFLIDRLIYFNKAEKSLVGLLRHFSRSSRRGGNVKKEAKQISINVANYLTPDNLNILERALNKSLMLGGDFYFYLLKFLFERKEIQEGLLRMDVPLREFRQRIEERISESLDTSVKYKPEALKMVESLMMKAFELSLANKSHFIKSSEIFSALAFINNEKMNQFLSLFSIDPIDLEKALIFSHFQESFTGLKKRLPITLGGFIAGPSRRSRHRTMNRAWTSKPTPFLDNFSVDFTDLARREKVGFLIGHQLEYDRLIDVLTRTTRPNVLLIGEPGSGKETLMAHLAFNLIKDEVPDCIFDKRLVALRIGDLISGSSHEEISKRLNKIAEEIIAAGNIILYIPDIHNLTKTFGDGYLSAADILMPFIKSNLFPIIGATYPKEYKQFIENQSDFVSTFESIRVQEISEDDSIRVLTYSSIILEKQYKLIISFGAIKQSVILAHKYFHHKLLPSSAEDLLKEALADASQKNEKVLSADMIIMIAERKTNIPIHRVDKREAENLLNLEKIIHRQLINQDKAVKAVSQALREYRSGLSRKGGPIAVFLFVGPTGVGKTELSKILSSIQFGSEDLMVRFDMSEYQTKESINRFIGSGDGKIAGTLIEAIIQKPYSLILLDEFEKAHQNILNLFLQVFDDGRLTDSLGRTVDFQNTIIIATSNAHSNFIKTQIEVGEPIDKITEELKKKLTNYFKPELLNRFSSVIVFKNLSRDDIKEIARLRLNELAKTLKELQGIDLIFSESVTEEIAKLGYDPVFGARPLRSVISDKLRSVLAEKILKNEIIKGSIIKVEFSNEGFKFL